MRTAENLHYTVKHINIVSKVSRLALMMDFPTSSCTQIQVQMSLTLNLAIHASTLDRGQSPGCGPDPQYSSLCPVVKCSWATFSSWELLMATQITIAHWEFSFQ